MELIRAKVVSKREEALNICSFQLVAEPGFALPAYTPGAHIDVHLPGEIIRQYSLCETFSDGDGYTIAVLRDEQSRGGSVALHDQVSEGTIVEISAPRNHFELSPDSSRVVLCAGGIGVTPLICMAEHLAGLGKEFSLHYFARSKAHVAFEQRISSSPYAASVQYHLDDAPNRPDVAALIGPPDGHLYACGPAGFIDYVFSAARARGWSEAQLHCEYFTGAAATPTELDSPFEVRIGSTDEIYAIPAGRSIVDVLSEAGYDIMTSCNEGVCGTCLTGVLEGVPDHRDVYLSPDMQASNQQILPCCSRSKTPVLVLDL